MNAWQPIAKAPINRDILVCDINAYAPETVRLTGNKERPVLNKSTNNYSSLWPTHWMPCPEPPNGDKEHEPN